MSGMNTTTGRALDGVDHIRQSIRDILTTRIGSRVMRRDYGSLLPELIDHPANPANLLRLQAASIMAILRWEPRVRITRTAFQIGMDGAATLDLEGERRDGQRAGQSYNLAVRVI